MPRIEGKCEQIHYPLYDTAEYDHTKTEIAFFQRPLGQQMNISAVTKDLRYTNMDAAGQLSGGERFEINAVRLFLQPVSNFGQTIESGVTLDVMCRALFGLSAVKLTVQNKDYLEVPGLLVPGGVGTDERYAVADPAAAQIRAYGQNGSPNPAAIFVLIKPIRIEEMENFRLTFYLGAWVAVAEFAQGEYGTITAVLDGILERPVQ